jgi:hypothetical protein
VAEGWRGSFDRPPIALTQRGEADVKATPDRDQQPPELVLGLAS